MSSPCFAANCVSALLLCVSLALPTSGWSADVTAKRIPWTTSRVKGTPDPPLPYRTERVYPQLRLNQPTAVRRVPGTEWMFAAEAGGKIRAFSQAASAATRVVLDLSDHPIDQYGVLDFTFHPRFPEEPWCYITYGLTPKSDAGLQLSRFRVELSDVPQIAAASELKIINWPNTGHSGGCVRFGPDGYLYTATGDGSGPNPPDKENTGQDLSDLLSAMLRIDVSESTEAEPYRIPADNPFVQLPAARGEIWAYGFRNPWKFCFDPVGGGLWVADVGWDTYELIYLVAKGGNYGWSVMEGSQSVRSDLPVGPTPILPPVIEHSHLEARSITGGEFYLGTRLPELTGALIYGDWMTGKVWGLRHAEDRAAFAEELVDTPLQVICFFVDPEGEVCIVGYDGTIHRLIPNKDVGQSPEFPRRLSDSGLFDSTIDCRPAPGVVSYSVIAEPWMDGAVAERFIGVPPDAELSVFAESNWEIGQVKGYISFPPDTVLAKTVLMEMEQGNPSSRRRIETQLLHKNGDAWQAYNYLWNDEQTDAVLADNRSSDRQFTIRDAAAPGGSRQQTWHHASRNECLMCHVWSGGSILGFKLHQLQCTDETSPLDNQLDRLQRLGLFAEPLATEDAVQISPADQSQTVAARARAYLDVNCSHCHRSEGGGLANFDARQENSLKASRLTDAALLQGDFGIERAGVIVPGHSERSVLLYRMSKLGRGRMPHLGSNVVDVEGLRLIRDWIRSIPPEGSEQPVDQARSELVAALQGDRATAARDLQRLIDDLLSTPSGAMAALHAVDDQSLPPHVTAKLIEVGAAHRDSRTRDLFERFLPESQRVRRVGSGFNLEELATVPGDRKEGRRLFLESSDLSCRNCHPMGTEHAAVGPDLRESVRQYDRTQLLEQIVFPSKKIDQKFQTQQIETIKGQVFTGLVVEESSQSVTLRDAAGKDLTIPKSSIEFVTRLAVSMMPEQQIRDLTVQQVADLLEFLTSLQADKQ